MKGQRKLVFAKFFFWKPGSELQRSLTALFRTLLDDTLRCYPDLIPKVLQDQWAKASMLSMEVSLHFHLRNDEIRKAFSRLVEYRNLYDDYCFCFLIDGLGEYEETR